MYDAIIVGARCAGAATALLLSRKGLRVLLLDRAEFPSDVPQGHFIHKQGPALLKQWGLLERIAASGCPLIDTMVLDLGDQPLTGTNLIHEGVPLGCGPRRQVLDTILKDAAVEAGAEFRPHFTVDELVRDGSAVKGVRGRCNGSAVTELARITIGADGKHSTVARLAGAATYEEVPSVTCWYFSYWIGTVVKGLEVYLRGENVIFAFPTNDGLTAVFVAWKVGEFTRVRASIEPAFWDVLDKVPDLAMRMRDVQRAERFYGTADVPNFFRKPYGDGWALAGDAGHHKDPYLALGISDALRDADLLASAVDDALGGTRELRDALAAYEQQRNASAMKPYRENLYMAQFLPLPPDLLRMRVRIAGDQEAINQYFLAQEGRIAPRGQQQKGAGA